MKLYHRFFCPPPYFSISLYFSVSLNFHFCNPWEHKTIIKCFLWCLITIKIDKKIKILKERGFLGFRYLWKYITSHLQERGGQPQAARTFLYYKGYQILVTHSKQMSIKSITYLISGRGKQLRVIFHLTYDTIVCCGCHLIQHMPIFSFTVWHLMRSIVSAYTSSHLGEPVLFRFISILPNLVLSIYHKLIVPPLWCV